jgi:type IV secretion system protein VirB5
MFNFKKALPVLATLAGIGLLPQAHAQFAVIDVAAVAQLITQVQTLEQQLLQAKEAFESMTGPRGMERLLQGTIRNYLPPDWQALADAIHGEGAGALAAKIRRLVEESAVLTAEQLMSLSETERQQIEVARHTVGMLQATARDALEATSQRFDSIQELIDAIGDAGDQKAVLDLQARIQAEQGMLQNESTKLQVIFQTAQAEEWSRRQRAREQAIDAIGSLRNLPPMGL